jgi:hypothetical protein
MIPLIHRCFMRRIEHGWGLGGVKTGHCDPRDQQVSGSLGAKGFLKYYLYNSVKIHRSASPIFLFKAWYSSNALMSTGGTCI